MPTIQTALGIKVTVKSRFESPTVTAGLKEMGIRNGDTFDVKDMKRVSMALFDAGFNVTLEHFPTGDVIWVERSRFVTEIRK